MISPDGFWTVNVYRKNRSLYPHSSVDVSVRVYDRQGNVAFEKIYYPDVPEWKADQCCSEITFLGGKILIGPDRFYGDGAGDFMIDTSEMKGMWLSEQSPQR